MLNIYESGLVTLLVLLVARTSLGFKCMVDGEGYVGSCETNGNLPRSMGECEGHSTLKDGKDHACVWKQNARGGECQIGPECIRGVFQDCKARGKVWTSFCGTSTTEEKCNGYYTVSLGGTYRCEWRVRPYVEELLNNPYKLVLILVSPLGMSFGTAEPRISRLAYNLSCNPVCPKP